MSYHFAFHTVHDGKASVYNAGDQGSSPGLGRSPGEGNGSPLQYYCLENPMDRGAWQVTVSGVAKSWTRLSDFTSLWRSQGKNTEVVCHSLLQWTTFCQTLERLLRVPWTAKRSNKSILKEISPECSLEGLMLKLKLQYFGYLMRRADSFGKILMLGKTERGRRRG